MKENDNAYFKTIQENIVKEMTKMMRKMTNKNDKDDKSMHNNDERQ